MQIKGLKYYFLLGLSFSGLTLFAQGNIEDLMVKEVENINPVYKPVIGVGYGAFTFLGDVRNKGQQTPFNGTPGYLVNVATFVDNNHYVRANFYFMSGTLAGSERSVIDSTRNMNFKSDILLFGINLNYDFDNFYKTYRKFHPYISLGFETFTFNSRSDMSATINGEVVPYNYWNDGSIRTLPQTMANANAPLMKRDYTYETSLRQLNWGQGNYSQYAFGLPLDVGFDFWLANRVLFRVGTSYHYVFTDNIDHVSSKNTSGIIGDSKPDNFMFSYISLHLDLFSSAKTLKWEKLFADVEFDPTLMGDEDGDGYFDGWDNCPGTPYGVATDTVGCPLDDDYDGIPNYLDDEPNSRYGAFVDSRGVEISSDELAKLLDMSNAVPRSEVSRYVRTPSSYSNYKKSASKQIPEKFKKVDKDGDGTITFDEMMNAIDNFFEFDSDLNTDDIYGLNQFFFSQ